MFVKIFPSIYDGSLGNDWQARLVFQDFLILADKDGVLDMTPEALGRRTNVPMEIILSAIPRLEASDPRSRTPDCAGARIVRLDSHRDWGWKIVNYAKYRESATKEMLRMAETERKAAYRHRHSKNSLPHTPSLKKNEGREEEAEADKSPPVPYVSGTCPGHPGHPTIEAALKWLADSNKSGSDYIEQEMRGAFLALSAGGWKWGNRDIADWRAALERQIQTDRDRKNKTNAQNPQRNGHPGNRRGAKPDFSKGF